MNKRKGFTLVEVLVSITIFLSVFAVILSTYYLAQKRVSKQEELQYIENLCLDIDKIYDNEGYSGLVEYYGFQKLDESYDKDSLKTVPDGTGSEDNYYKSDTTDDSTPDDDSSSTDTDGTSEENASNDDSTSTDTGEGDTSTDTDRDDTSADDTTTEEENNNQIKNVVNFLINGKKADKENYLGTIDKTLKSTTTSTRDENGDPIITTEERYNGDESKKYDVSIQKYTLEYENYIHEEKISKITYQNKTYSKENSIYLDSNYKLTTASDYKYLLTYTYKTSLYEVNTYFDVIDTTKSIEETYDKYTTTASYTKATSSEEVENYIEDTIKEDYSPTVEETKSTITEKSSTVTSNVQKKYREYILDIQANTSLTISITNTKDNYVLIKDLEYGSSKYDDTYINSIKEEIEVKEGEKNGN